MKGLCALSKELALKNCFFSFFNLQCWVLSSRTKQSSTAIMDSRHICHVVSPWEVIDFLFFFPPVLSPVMKVLIREGQQQFIRADAEVFL